MNRADAEEYTQSLGQIIGGSWRQVHLARKLGVPAALGLSTEEWVNNLGGYVKLNIPERREAVLDMQAEGLSQRAMAEVLGVDEITVRRDLKSATNVADDNSDSEEMGNGSATNVASPSKAHVSNNSGETEWYTPPEYLAAARKVMGAIDLDPASSSEANEVVLAKEFFDAEKDGLNQNWKGRVWMNPPYAAVQLFTDKLLNSPKVTEAIVLTNNATDTQWFHALANDATAICFHLGRIKFWRSGQQSFTPLQGQVFFYFGPNREQFESQFSQYGLVF